MNREVLIQKWLDHDLNLQELEAFKQLEDYNDLIQLDAHLKGFKAETLPAEEALETVWSSINSKPKTSNKLLSTLSKIAAVLVICFGVFYYTTTIDTNLETLAAEHKSIALPDASQVELNALSSIAFNTNSWDNHREVTCYEGKVRVKTTTKNIILLPGDTFLIIDGKYIATEKENLPTPSWLNSKSMFKSIPYREVIAEFERQYNTTVEYENINGSQNFTGSFTHNDIEIALKSITLPLQLKYSKSDNIIRLKRD